MREVHKIWNLQIFPHKILEHFSKISMSIVYHASPTLLLMHTYDVETAALRTKDYAFTHEFILVP